MQPYFAKFLIGAGFEPVLNWFQSTAHDLMICNRAVSAVDWNQFNTGSNPVPIETFAQYDRIDHLWLMNPL